MTRAALAGFIFFLAGSAGAATQDSLERRITPCSSCHGKQGQGLRTNEYNPSIAGKPAGYLYNQLLNFRAGRRQSAVMTYMVENLSSDYLREIAAHYANMPAHPSAPVAAVGGEVLARGEALVKQGDRGRNIPACVACHGDNLRGMEPAIPGLVGLDPQYVAQQMGAWRNKLRRAREPDCMATVASLLQPGDISAITAWLSSRAASAREGPLPAGSLKPPVRCGSLDAPAAEDAAATTTKSSGPVARGEYLVRAGGCYACHTTSSGAPYAGGRAIPTPFGTIYSTNLTPEPDTGLGRWSADDFWRALHEGIGRDGALLYPAFPYPNYTRVHRADADAMFAYLRTLTPVRAAARAPEMRFPYDQRPLLAGWRALYFDAGEHQDDPKQTAQWNRGAYLVQGLGHCTACHAARNTWGAVTTEHAAGGLIPVLNWYAPSLTSNRETGLGAWEIADVVDLLTTGISRRGAVFGPMAEVVRDSLQHLDAADVAAMAVYLKSQAAEEDRGEGARYPVSSDRGKQLSAFGGRVYRDHHCVDCHKADGRGMAGAYPPLAGNEAILMRNPVNAIRMTLNGGFPPSTRGNPRPYGMPPFSHVLRDEEVAAVVTYIRGAWGNHADAVSPLEVAGVRGVPLTD